MDEGIQKKQNRENGTEVKGNAGEEENYCLVGLIAGAVEGWYSTLRGSRKPLKKKTLVKMMGVSKKHTLDEDQDRAAVSRSA